MQRFNSWKVKSKLLLLLSMFALGFLAFALVSYDTLRQLQVNGPYYHKIVAGKDVIADVLPPPEYIIESYLLTLQMADPANRALVPRLIKDSRRLRQEYDTRHEYWVKDQVAADSPMMKPLLEDSYRPALAFFAARDNQFIPAVQRGDYVRARALAQGTLKGSYQEHRAAINRVVELANAYNAQVEKEARDAIASRTTLLTALIFGLIGPLVIGLGYTLSRSISRTLGESVGALSATSSQMAATVEEHERTAVNQSAAVHQTTTTMDELDASFNGTAEMVRTAATTAQQAAAVADSGLETVSRTLEGLHTLRGKVSTVAEQISNLSEQTSQIGTIARAVSEMANQTNMLALNAAVEAARAGEHGKGFGVVAGEIRKLADASKKSAERINSLVEDVKRATDATVMATEESSKGVEADILLAEQTAQAFNGIVGACDSALDAAQQTLLTVPQQVAAVKQVLAAMEDLNRGAREAASGLGQTKESVSSLRETALKLKAMI
ncbi:MAG TPA: methyl-accepting chemotaxis protein [Abditibacterium sp.]|jgi:methyl-accepting chemotaxis protein